MSETSYRAWLFDLDGTLYHPKPLKLAMGLELVLLGLPVLRIVTTFRREHEKLRDQLELETAANPFEQQLARTAEKLGVSPAEVRGVITRWMIDRPCRWLPRLKRQWLIDELRAFRKDGGRTAVVSDYPARRKLTALNLSDAFDVIVASGEALGPDRLKPDPGGYLKAAQALGMKPAECLVIGDRDDADGAAARAAGMAFRQIS